MASQTAPVKSKEAPAAVAVNSSTHQLHEHAQSRIAARAYELYQQDGHNHGEDMSHWLRAESEILTRVPEIHESSSWFTINVPLKGFFAAEVQVNMEPHRAIIAAAKNESSEQQDGTGTGSFQEATFAVAKWPSEVDPSTASAYLKDGTLTVAVKRALPTGGTVASSDFESKQSPDQTTKRT
jgi:HSP20 family molecular chaperone IbpA